MLRYLMISGSDFKWGLIAAPVVFYLVWLFNTHRLGRLTKPSETDEEVGNVKYKRNRILAVCGAAATVTLSLIFIFFI